MLSASLRFFAIPKVVIIILPDTNSRANHSTVVLVNHNLNVEFDFDSARLSKALSAVGSCLAHPKMKIKFTVKDATAINEEMLCYAIVKAKRKAEILCETACVELGDF